MEHRGKLELTWVGKYDDKVIEPRILVEDIEKSYGDPHSENMLIHGDNLLALKALEQDFSGMVKCIYIDPPFNTGSAFEHYDDGVEHSIWLDLMWRRLRILHSLLSEDGCIFINLDDNESAYAKIILDEIFGRSNYLNEIIVTTNKAFGYKSTSGSLFKQANHILFYAKDRQYFLLNKESMFIEKEYDTQYKWVFQNMEQEEKMWVWKNIKDVVAEKLGFNSAREARRELEESFDQEIATYAIENADRVFRTASVTGGALLKRRQTINSSKNNKKIIYRHPGDDMDYMFIGGERVIFYKERLKEIDGLFLPGELLTDIWTDISIEGLANEGGVNFPKGKKPEKLIKRCLEIGSLPGDLVLDSFLGSGTTAAVAHKMGRKYIGIELGEQANTHCLKRLVSVVEGDQSGISKSVNWKGGGGFKFYELAESMLVRNSKLPIYQINPNYTYEMLCEAICKIEGFRYQPSGTYHGHSSEKRFIHVTMEFVNAAYIRSVSSTLGDDQSLLIYGTKIQSDLRLPNNIEIKRIPKDLLTKCDYESEVR